jgi:hypothetical protein
MAKQTKGIPPKLQKWIDARQRHHLSHAHVQMARELGMNPAKLGSIDNHRQERWKAPLPEFIEDLYLKRFGRERPETVISIEERARALNKARFSERGSEGSGPAEQGVERKAARSTGSHRAGEQLQLPDTAAGVTPPRPEVDEP